MRRRLSTGIVVVILLASKQALDSFVSKGVTMVEFYDTLKFLAVVFVVFPLRLRVWVGSLNLSGHLHPLPLLIPLCLWPSRNLPVPTP